MTVTVGDLYDWVDRTAPFSTAMDFDNAGLLVGDRTTPVTDALVALDITHEVVAEAKKAGVQVILSHHPVIFQPLKRLSSKDVPYQLASCGIAAICAHTNLDAVCGGVNDALANALGLTDVKQLCQDGVDEQGNPYGIGRVGLVPTQSVEEFAALVKEHLNAACVRLVDGGKSVHRVAVGGGSCGSMLGDVLAAGCDTFVTSDVKYDVFLAAKAQGLNLLDAGHYPTENMVCPVLETWLKEASPTLQVSISQRHHEVYHCV